uniref:Uncharacterized protein n=1 Tax=Arundo donax TaxID=35708 RepID=A0A0A8XT87_ARUDO
MDSRVRAMANNEYCHNLISFYSTSQKKISFNSKKRRMWIHQSVSS